MNLKQIWVNHKDGQIITIGDDKIERHFKEVRRQRTHLTEEQVKDADFCMSNGYEPY